MFPCSRLQRTTQRTPHSVYVQGAKHVAKDSADVTARLALTPARGIICWQWQLQCFIWSCGASASIFWTPLQLMSGSYHGSYTCPSEQPQPFDSKYTLCMHCPMPAHVRHSPNLLWKSYTNLSESRRSPLSSSLVLNCREQYNTSTLATKPAGRQMNRPTTR